MIEILCKLCNKSPVDFNGHVCKECIDKGQMQAKANIVLMDSESQQWGLCMLTPGTVNHVPAESELVGTWSRYGEGTYWVSLMMPMEALMDRTTILIAEVAKRRSLNLPLIGKVRVKVVRKEPSVKPEPKQEPIIDLSALREKLKSLRND